MYRLKNTILFLMIIFFVSGSCKSRIKKDLSLTVKEYQAKGMPAIDKPWTEQELMKAHVTLGSIRTKTFNALPRKGSRKSGEVFSRIVSKENLSFLNDPAKPLHDMAFDIQTMASFVNEVGRMYTDNFKIEQYYSEELIEIYIFEIYVREQMLILADKIMNSKDQEDMAMQQGRQAIVNGYVSTITMLIKIQGKTKSYSQQELKRLNSFVAHSVTENLKFLDTKSKQEISGEIKSIYEKSEYGYLRQDFDKILKSLSD